LDAANEDTLWAARAGALLPSARHRTLPASRPESLFDVGYVGADAGLDPEGPATWAAGLSHVRDVTSRAAAEGSTRHLVGIGGDELFGLMPAYPWSFTRQRPITGFRLANRYRQANRWSLRATVRALLDRSTFAENLGAQPHGYSTRSAAAAGCAADHGRLLEYSQALFADQPQEGSPGLSDDELISVATRVGITAPSFAACVHAHTYRPWARYVTETAYAHDITSTPTILVAGKPIDVGAADVTAELTAAVRAAGPQ
jgi:hypothetical protein